MDIKGLMTRYAKTGKVVSISVRPARMAPVKVLDFCNAIQNKGLEGDRAKGGNRQVTLIQKEHINAVASYLGKDTIDFTLTRRNILAEGINLQSLKGKRFRIGGAVLEYTGPCDPCSRMEEALGAGGYNAMRGHGGITAKVVVSGEIRKDDQVLPEKVRVF